MGHRESGIEAVTAFGAGHEGGMPFRLGVTPVPRPAKGVTTNFGAGRQLAPEQHFGA